MTQVAKHLLTQTATIRRLYDKIEKSQGLRFNIFELLSVQHSEVYTHSAFIADLLNPKGSHDKGTVFLEAFYHSILAELKFDSAANYEVFVEYYIGKKTETEGGRIDILVQKNNRPEIVIENKIYASEQENQLLRYYNFIQEKKSNAPLLYLTLDGSESADATLSPEKEYIPVSYATHILQWLESCTQLAADHPTLRETIVQYIQLIQKLTNQHSNQLMENDLQRIILEDTSKLKAFFDLQRMESSIKHSLIKKYGEEVKDFCKSSDKFELSKLELSYNRYAGFNIHNEFLRSKNLTIRFEFELSN